MDIKNLTVLHEKVGENDHYYYVAPSASLDEVEFVANRFLSYILERKESAKQAVQNVPAPTKEEPKAE